MKFSILCKKIERKKTTHETRLIQTFFDHTQLLDRKLIQLWSKRLKDMELKLVAASCREFFSSASDQASLSCLASYGEGTWDWRRGWRRGGERMQRRRGRRRRSRWWWAAAGRSAAPQGRPCTPAPSSRRIRPSLEPSGLLFVGGEVRGEEEIDRAFEEGAEIFWGDG